MRTTEPRGLEDIRRGGKPNRSGRLRVVTTSDVRVSFGRRVSELAAADPDQPALVVARSDPRDDVLLTRRDLDTRSSQIARVLQDLGLGKGGVLVIGLPNGVDHVVTALAGLKLGATVLPLCWDTPAWERQRQLEVARPALVVADWDVDVPCVTPTVLRELAAGMPGDPLPDVVSPRPFAVGTGGSTGVPKIVLTPVRGGVLPDTAEDVLYRIADIGPGVRHIVGGPLYHGNAFLMLHNGLFDRHQVVLLERFDAALWVDAVQRYQVEFGSLVPTMMRRIASLPGLDRARLASLRAVLHTGAPCPPELKRRWIDLVGARRLVEAFGSTEGVGIVTIRGDEWLEHPGSVGRPFLTNLRVLDDTGAEVGPGTVGLIYMRPHDDIDTSFSYLGGPPPLRTADGFVSVGDLGWLDSEGWLYCADKRADLIVSGGANIYPAEVEAALLDHPQVLDVAVIGLPHPDWGQTVHAFVQPHPEQEEPTVPDLDAFVRGRIAAYKVPKGYTVVADLPRDGMGKIRRSQLALQLVQAREHHYSGVL